MPLNVLDRTPSLVDDSVARSTPGALYEDRGTGEIYMYVKHAPSTATPSVATKLACFKAGGGAGAGPGAGVVTMVAADITSGTLSTTTKAAGIYVAAVVKDHYCMILVWSPYTHCFTDGGVVDGDALVCDGGGTETFIADTAADGEEECIFGWALADDISTDVICRVNFL